MKLDEISNRLTVNERFMVHILPYQAYQENWDVPHDITQKGLAEGIPPLYACTREVLASIFEEA